LSTPKYAHRSVIIAGIILCFALGSCATYHARPLQPVHDSGPMPERIQVDSRTMPLPELAAHRFDPSDGLDMTETAMLAVANNPDLRLARDDLGIARAQAFAAGLLPDPQLSVENDYPAPAGLGLTRAFNYGLSIDVMAILMRSSNQHSADANAAKTDLGLLWQEWQTIAQARQLFLKAVFLDREIPLLNSLNALAQQRYLVSAQAVHAGNLTADAQTLALTAAQDAARQLADAQLQRVQTRHDLNALLGINAQSDLHLVDTDHFVPLDATQVHAALADLPQRRPDLLALKAGYRAQEMKYRAAILGQFPNLTLGFVRARDTSDVYTSGFQANLSLPIFNRNRGNIAIERATRERLNDEFQNRMQQAYADVDRLQAATEISMKQQAQLAAQLPQFAHTAHEAQIALHDHNLALGAYIDAQTAWLTKEIEAATLKENLAEQRVALQALLGAPLPDAYSNDSRLTEDHAE
jgi:outer membrane protein TolC